MPSNPLPLALLLSAAPGNPPELLPALGASTVPIRPEGPLVEATRHPRPTGLVRVWRWRKGGWRISAWCDAAEVPWHRLMPKDRIELGPTKGKDRHAHEEG